MVARLKKTGYLCVHLSVDGKGYHWPVHKCVAFAFLGKRPSGYHINHIDGNKQNPSVKNLEYVTMLRNHRHAMEMGLKAYGERNTNARVSEATAKRILKAIMKGSRGSGQKIAARFGVSNSMVSKLKLGQTWKLLPRSPK